MKSTPDLLELRGEIESALQARVESDIPAEETPQELAGESQPSMEEGAEEATPVDPDAQTEAEQAIRYVNDLARAHGMDPEEFYKMPIKLGGDREIPLGEAKDRIAQLDQEHQQIEQQKAQLQEQARALYERAAQEQQAQTQLTQRQQAAQQMIAGLQAQYRQKAQDWEKRRDLEPGKVALEQQELGAAYAQAQQELQAAQQEATQQQGMARQKWLMEQNSILSQAIPEWAAPESRKGLQSELQQFAISRYQATPQELQNLDAKTILLLRDAMEGVKAKAEAEKALANVRDKAPVVPRTARQAATQQQRADIAALEKQALATGKTQHKLAAARAILGRR